MGLLAKEIGSNQIKSLTSRKLLMKFVIKEKLEYMKGIIKGHKLHKGRQCSNQIDRTTGQTMIYKTLHRKLQIEEHRPHKTPG